jgi:hypothetical protein
MIMLVRRKYTSLLVVSSLLIVGCLVCLIRPSFEQRACGCTSGFIASRGQVCDDCLKASSVGTVFNALCILLSTVFVVVFCFSFTSFLEK